MKEKLRCPICHDKVSVKDGKFVEHPKMAWNYAALKLGPSYRCSGSGTGISERKDKEIESKDIQYEF